MRPRPIAVLTRHFISGIVAPPLLTDLGVDFLRRTIAGVLAIVIVPCFFLTEAFVKKYMYLYAAWDRDAYLRAVDADTLLMISVPMLVVGVVAVLLSPLLFPDELDYRTLSPLPVTRAELFVSKLLAVALVAFVWIVGVNAIISLWFPVATGGRWMPQGLGTRMAAHAAASLGGSVWMFSAVMALQGLCLVALPRRWRRSIGATLQGAVFVGLLLSVPYVLRMPTFRITAETAAAAPLAWVPPVWFLGVERTLLAPAADGYSNLAVLAGWAMLATVTLVAITYLSLYRSAETLASDSRPAGPLHDGSARLQPRVGVNSWLPQPTCGVLAFALRGLARSRLHYIVVLLVAGVGVAILIGQVLTVTYGATFLGYGPRIAEHAVVAAPLVLGLATVLALRAALLLPLDREAAWLFRITEAAPLRAASLDAVTYLFTIATVVPALVTALVLQPPFLGARSVAGTALSTLANLLLVEIVLLDWARLPFTCSFLPGKRVLAFTLGVLLATYFVFVYIGAHIIGWSSVRPLRAAIVGGALALAWVSVRRSRLRTWGRRALEFEDEDPLAIRTLNLLPDERQ